MLPAFTAVTCLHVIALKTQAYTECGIFVSQTIFYTCGGREACEGRYIEASSKKWQELEIDQSCRSLLSSSSSDLSPFVPKEKKIKKKNRPIISHQRSRQIQTTSSFSTAWRMVREVPPGAATRVEIEVLDRTFGNRTGTFLLLTLAGL